MATQSIIIAGDVVQDWMLITLPAAASPPSPWQRYGTLKTRTLPGGALLLADLMRSGATVLGHKVSVLSYKRDDYERVSPEQIVRTFVTLQRFDDNRFRVKEFNGFCGTPTSTPAPMQYQDDLADAGLVIINDTGNSFRHTPTLWPKALCESTSPIILKLSPPFCHGDLWSTLQSAHSDRVLVVAAADELRNAGVPVSRGVSWDRAAADCVVAFDHNEIFKDLARFPNVLVRFGLDGVLHYSRDGQEKFRISYDPDRAEGEYAENFKGSTMSGFAATFCASLALDLHREPGGFDNAIRQALASSRRLLETGYGEDDQNLGIQYQQVFGREQDAREQFAISHVPGNSRKVSMTSWSFVHQIVGEDLPELAEEIVRHGNIPPGVPLAKFGALETLDRSEAESYRSILNLFREFLSKSTSVRPLSIAVFGQPGTGKSFGITEIATSLDADAIKTGPPFNLAQFTSIRDLIDAFHRVRDIALGGQVPLVFFDEFDSKFEAEPLGWLKYSYTDARRPVQGQRYPTSNRQSNFCVRWRYFPDLRRISRSSKRCSQRRC